MGGAYSYSRYKFHVHLIILLLITKGLLPSHAWASAEHFVLSSSYRCWLCKVPLTALLCSCTTHAKLLTCYGYMMATRILCRFQSVLCCCCTLVTSSSHCCLCMHHVALFKTMTWIIPFEVNNMHEVSKFPYTPVHGRVRKTWWPSRNTSQTKGRLTCY